MLVPKAEQQYRVIGWVDSIWKFLSGLINARLQKGMVYHQWVHGFRKERGMSIAILEVKVLVFMAEEKGKVVYQVFLDMKSVRYHIASDGVRTDEGIWGWRESVENV